MERRPEELEFEEAYGLPTDVFVLATVLLEGRGAELDGRGVELVKVKVKYWASSRFQTEMIMLAWSGV